MERLTVKVGDITMCETEAVVDPITEEFNCAGTVSEAIFAAAGPELKKELAQYEHCREGDVIVTNGYEMPAKSIFHIVSPKWNGGDLNEGKRLEACYYNCLRKAADLGKKSIVFPSISTGLYHFPVNIAASIAMRTICGFLKEHDIPETVTLVCSDQRTTLVYDMCKSQECKR